MKQKTILKCIFGLLIVGFFLIFLSMNTGADYSDIDIEIEKFSYTPEETVNFNVVVEGNGTFKVNITDEKGDKIQNAEWKNQKIRDSNEFNYEIPNNIKSGDYIIKVFDTDRNITVSTHNFEIRAIIVNFETDSKSYLPGSEISIYYTISWIKDGREVNNGIVEYNITYWKQYAKEDFGILEKSYLDKKIPSKNSYGEININLPDDAVPGRYGASCQVKIIANTSDNKHSDMANDEFYIAPPQISINIIDEKNQYKLDDFLIAEVETMTGREFWEGYTNSKQNPDIYNNRVVFFSKPELIETNGSKYKYGYIDGSSVWLDDIPINRFLPFDSISPLKESQIDMLMRLKEKDDKYTDTKYKATGLKTNALGKTKNIFTLGDDLKNGEYTLNATLKNTPISGKSSTTTKDFKVGNGKQMIMTLSTDKQIYSQNEKVDVYYYLYYDSKRIFESVVVDYVIRYENNNQILTSGRIVVTPNKFTFTTPDNFEGNLKIEVVLTNSTGEKTMSTISIEVRALQIIINSDNLEYNPGEMISVDYEIFGGKNVKLFYTISILGGNGYLDIFDKVLDSKDYNIISYGEPINGSIKPTKIIGTILYDVSLNSTSDSYKIKLYVIDNSNGNYAEKEIEFNIASLVLNIAFDKKSYEPGDTVKVKYEVLSRTDKKVDNGVKFIYGITGIQEGSYESIEEKGEFEFIISKEIPDGDFIIIFNENNNNLASIQTIHIESSPIFPWFEIFITIIAIIGIVLGGVGLRTARKKDKEIKKLKTGSKTPKKGKKTNEIIPVFKKIEPIPLKEQVPPKPITPTIPTNIPPPPSDFNIIQKPEPTKQESIKQPPITTEKSQEEQTMTQSIIPDLPAVESIPQKITHESPLDESSSTKCPRCGADVLIPSIKRPVEIKCSKCGLEGTID